MDTIKLLSHFTISPGPCAIQTCRLKSNNAVTLILFIGFIIWLDEYRKKKSARNQELGNKLKLNLQKTPLKIIINAKKEWSAA